MLIVVVAAGDGMDRAPVSGKQLTAITVIQGKMHGSGCRRCDCDACTVAE